jgi:hypothetical protein
MIADILLLLTGASIRSFGLVSLPVAVGGLVIMCISTFAILWHFCLYFSNIVLVLSLPLYNLEILHQKSVIVFSFHILLIVDNHRNMQ